MSSQKKATIGQNYSVGSNISQNLLQSQKIYKLPYHETRVNENMEIDARGEQSLRSIGLDNKKFSMDTT